MGAPKVRLEVRVKKEIFIMLKRAAEMEERSLSDFVNSAAEAAAKKTIADAAIIRLSLQDQLFFAESMSETGKVNPAMQKALEQHDRLIEYK